MDVSQILASQASKHKSILVEKELSLDVDAAFLTVTDPNTTDKESYDQERETYLQANARDGVQLLIAALFSFPTHSSPEGPLAQLPAPTTQLPRAKPLPKPKPLTKWEKFARTKGIRSERRDKKAWDEERQDWVPRWGWKGKNKDDESQWLHEVPANADTDYDPSKEARVARKARVVKNEHQRLQNLARAQQGVAVNSSTHAEHKKKEIERSLVTTRASTASMGRFDPMLPGEKKPRGLKRKFDPIEQSVEAEKSANLALIKKLGSDHSSMKKARQDTGDGDRNGNVLNVRKAVRFASNGQGAAALASKSGSAVKKKQRGKR